MADRLKGITIEIGGDTTKLSKALSSVNKEIKNTQSDLKDVERLLKMDPGNTDLLKQKQQLLADAVKETKEKLDALKTAQAQMDASGVDKNSEAYQRLQREIIETEARLKEAEKAADSFNATGEKLKAYGDKIKGVGSAVTEVGKDMTTKVTVPIVTGLGTAVKIAADFDTAMSQVKAITGANNEEFQVLRDTAREWGGSTKYSAEEVAEAFTYMGMAGWKTEQMIAGIGGVLNLAAASGEDLATTSDIVTDAMTAFGMTADETQRFVDVLAATSTNANTNVSLMGETFKYVAPTAGALGYEVEDVAAAIGLMGNAGIKGSQAGTALNSLMTRMAKPTKESADAMDRLGISLQDDEGNMYSFMEIMEQMRDSFGQINMPIDEFDASIERLIADLEDGNITEKEYSKQLEELTMEAYGAEGAEKARAAAMLAGKTGMAGLLAIVNASEEDFGKLTKAIDSSTGSAEGMANTMKDNLSGQLTELKSATEELAISFGDMLMPYVRDTVEKIQDLVAWFNGLDETQKKTILTIALVVAAIGPCILILGGLISAVGTIVTALGGFITVCGSVVAILGGPVTIAIVAITAVMALFCTHWEQIKTTVQNVIDAVKQKVEEIKKEAIAKFEEIKKKVTEFIEGAQKAVSENVEAIRKAIVDKVGEAVKFLEDLPGKALAWGRDLIQNFVDGLLEKWNSLKETVSGIAEGIADFLGFSEPKKGPLSRFHTFAPDMMDLYAKGINENKGVVTNAVAGLAGNIASIMNHGTTANINLTSTLNLDGNVIAEAVNRELGVRL